MVTSKFGNCGYVNSIPDYIGIIAEKDTDEKWFFVFLNIFSFNFYIGFKCVELLATSGFLAYLPPGFSKQVEL